MDCIALTSQKPHAVCIPFPAQGHINPMLKLAKLLHFKGFHITFVNTEFIHKRLLKSQGPNSLDGFPSFRFETIPDGLPPTDANVATQHMPSLCESTRKNCLAPFRDLLLKLNSSPNSPPVTCIVADGIMNFTLDAAQELGLPEVIFWTTSACGFMGYLQYRNLIEKGLVPLKDDSYFTNGYLDTVIDWIPGMKGIQLKDIPTFIRTTDPNDPILHVILHDTERVQRASAIILNTFDALEHEVLEAISHLLPPIYSIGPLYLQLNQIPAEDNTFKLTGASLWREEPDCFEWLDSKEPSSVIYVNFGSSTVMTDEQLIEFTWGLAATPFFGGLLASWCCQGQVLSHPAIGGFLTHSGWNSTIESVCGGVPMICWPFNGEQQTNCRYCCKEWGIGMEMEGDVKRNYIESLVRKLMQEKEGKEMRKKSMEWKKLAEKAITGPHGSSFLDLDKMVNQVLLSPRD
ncbi:putative cyanohydrin beta-glucosyltransferase [Rosa chinensis]|uniref:Glycosyltransferase n=1 Tax=Rosa chinensis TaxID=74649 RepID=A0A2P6PIT7_ROSCH|nr:putative cyanohydrin beta-glucosyltransferase [Rosa chinensis]